LITLLKSFRVLGRSSGWSKMCDPQLQRSHVSRHAIKLALTNRSGKDVKLIWRDYAGQRREHAELKESHRSAF